VKKPNLKTIKLPLEEKDKRLSGDKEYLAKIPMCNDMGYVWVAGRFKMQWHGWTFHEFQSIMSGRQIDITDWQCIYEIVEGD